MMEIKIFPDGSWELFEENNRPIVNAPSDDYCIRKIPDDWDDERIDFYASCVVNGRQP